MGRVIRNICSVLNAFYWLNLLIDNLLLSVKGKCLKCLSEHISESDKNDFLNVEIREHFDIENLPLHFKCNVLVLIAAMSFVIQSSDCI